MSADVIVNNSNSINNTNTNQNSTSPLNVSSTFQRRERIKQRWESFRKNHQSVENNSRGTTTNNLNNENEETFPERNSINNALELNREENMNSDNNLHPNTNNHNNNDMNNINQDLNRASSPSTQSRELRRVNYIGRQNRHLLLTIYNNNLIQDNNDADNEHIIDLQNNGGRNNNRNSINNSNNDNTDNNLDNNNLRNNIIPNNMMSNITNNNRLNNSRKNSGINKIEEEEKKKEDLESEADIYKEENIGSEIKDTVKCYIFFDKITKPKMCPHCHRIACEKCLYNWFINLKKNKCGFCRLNSNFKEMISVPFMEAIVTFVEKYFNKRKVISETIDKEFLEYCPEHKNEMLYYYCLDCGKPYCKTCFVFFGAEKDKHIGHRIIEYEKYKNMSIPLLKKNYEKLESNIQHVEENIKRCLAFKQSYEHERKVGNNFLKNLQNEFNKQIDDIISIIDNQISRLKDYIDEYNKYKIEVENFYGVIKNKKNSTDKSCESLIIKLTKINQRKFFSSKDIEKLNELSKRMYVNTYQSKIGEFNHENIFLSKGLKMGSSPYELVIDNKQRNEAQISLIIPKEKTQINHSYQAFIFIRQKGECIQTYDLDEYKEDDNFYYLKKKIPWDYFVQSLFKIKGVLYDFYFE